MLSSSTHFAYYFSSALSLKRLRRYSLFFLRCANFFRRVANVLTVPLHCAKLQALLFSTQIDGGGKSCTVLRFFQIPSTFYKLMLMKVVAISFVPARTNICTMLSHLYQHALTKFSSLYPT